MNTNRKGKMNVTIVYCEWKIDANGMTYDKLDSVIVNAINGIKKPIEYRCISPRVFAWIPINTPIITTIRTAMKEYSIIKKFS